MREKIQQLIAFHLEARGECLYLLNKLTQQTSAKERKYLTEAITKTEQEIADRLIFIQDLESLL